MALVIRMNVPFDGPTHYFVFDQGVVTAMNFGGYQEWGTDPNSVIESYHELVFPGWDFVPHCLIDLSKITKGLGYNTKKVVTAFKLAWEVVCEEKEVKVEVAEKKFIPYKALMLFNTDEPINGYDKDVFLWNSVDGVKRMSFYSYLEEVQKKHDGEYKLAKLSMAKVSNLAVADFRFLQSAGLNGAASKSEKIYMVFRNLWYYATGEEMAL